RQDTPLAVCVGRVTRQKGQDVLLSAWQDVRGDAELAIVGDGDLLPSLQSRDVPGVRFVGAVDDVRTWLAAADLVVLPSRWEGLPLTALEALATGRPVVASDVPGLAEVITPSVGQLVPAERATDLASALNARLGNPALRRRESEAAAARAAEFDLRRTFDQLAAATVDVATAVPTALQVTKEQRAWCQRLWTSAITSILARPTPSSGAGRTTSGSPRSRGCGSSTRRSSSPKNLGAFMRWSGTATSLPPA